MKNILFKFSFILIVFTLFGFNGLKSQSNQYLAYDGVDDWVSATNASALIAGTNTYSMTGWFFDNALAYGQGMMGFRSATQSFYMIELNNGSIECRLINAANVTYEIVAPAGTIIPNLWQHFAFVYDGTNISLYLNGNLVGSHAASGTPITSTTLPFAIGRSTLGSSFGFYYNGRIDEVTLWSKGLTQAEVQSIKTTEPSGSESGLLLYYKFNQGVPGGNNTGISKLHTEVNSPLYDADILNFAMTGTNSNFNGTLNTTFQAISFPQIPTQLTTSPPVKMNATSTAGLPVSYSLVSGPATISNDSIYLTGTPGTVKIRAYQNGNAQYDSAVSVFNTFEVVNPALNLPIIEARHPLAGNVYMPTLSKIQLAAFASINYTSLFSIQELHFKISSTTIPAHDFGNGHYTAWWQPTAYGNYTVEIISTNNFGAVGSTTVNINVSPSATDTTVQAFSNILINTSVSSVIVEGQLPSFIGAYDTIIATLTVTCPSGGCGAWDHTASVEAKSHEGNWYEIIRYITPYATSCSHKINLADYMSILNGKVTFRVSCGTLDNGYLYALSFQYKEGTPAYKYSQVSQVWRNNYDFGNYLNLQPVSIYNYTYPPAVVSSKLKLISTGHMGPNNTSNAAEFYDATHHIFVNNVNTFTQHNWTTCNPNPDNCMPQSGTWQYSRAGWCPGAIARPFDYDMNTFLNSSVALKYEFYTPYIDQCNANYPGCVSDANCSCSDGANPFLVVDCNMINFFTTPPPDPQILASEEIINDFELAVYPNPSKGVFNLSSYNKLDTKSSVVIYNLMGKIVHQFEWKGENISINITNCAPGIYLMKISNERLNEIKKLIIR